MRLFAALLALLGALFASVAMAQQNAATPSAAPSPVPTPTPDNIWVLELSTGGRVLVQLRPDKAPQHVERIKALTRAGFYNGLTFHRVIDGFMAQGGDPKGTGEGGSDLPDLKAEFNDLPHVRGVTSMARAEGNDTANSQFFIMLMPTLRLDNRYTAFGRVLEGMRYVDALEKGEPPITPGRILKAYIQADGPNAAPVPLPAVTPAPAASPTPTPEATPQN
jgi:cyclophilin family peptidyl-prolyl cis-trans isomerase